MRHLHNDVDTTSNNHHQEAAVECSPRASITEEEVDGAVGIASSIWRMPRRQKGVVACIHLYIFIYNVYITAILPFFPQEASRRGMNQVVVGLLFGIFDLVQFLSAPIFRKMTCMNSKTVFLTGTFFSGLFTVGFGLQGLIPDEMGPVPFTIGCFVFRILTSLAETSGDVAAHSIATHSFPDNPAMAYGFTETTAAIANMIGPPLGGALYEVSGMVLPMTLLGGLTISFVPLFFFLLPPVICPPTRCLEPCSNSLTPTRDVGHPKMSLMKLPTIGILLTIVFGIAVAWVTTEPILGLHLKQFALSPSKIGLVFMMMAALYALLSPLVGLIAERMRDNVPLMLTGLVLAIVSLLFMGPSPIFKLWWYQKLWLKLVALAGFSIGCNLALVPTFEKILEAAQDAGVADEMSTHGAVAGLFVSVYTFGEFVGPLVSTSLDSTLGFGWCMTVVALLLIVVMLLTLSLWFYECRTRPTVEESRTHHHTQDSDDNYDLEDADVFVNAEDNLHGLAAGEDIDAPNEEDAV